MPRPYTGCLCHVVAATLFWPVVRAVSNPTRRFRSGAFYLSDFVNLFSFSHFFSVSCASIVSKQTCNIHQNYIKIQLRILRRASGMLLICAVALLVFGGLSS